MRVKSSGIRPAAALSALLCLAALLLLALLFAPEGRARWRLEPGTGRVYAVLGNSFACVSSTGLRVYGPDGEELLSVEERLSGPALSARDGRLAAWDMGGDTLYLAGERGELVEVDAGGALAAVRVSGSGLAAAVTLGGGENGSVTVYGASGEALYRWHAETVWPLDACVSPDGEFLAVLAASERGGEVRVFRLDDTAMYAAFTLPGELLFALDWLDGGTLCAVSAERALFLSRECALTAEYSMGSFEAVNCRFGGGDFAVLELTDGDRYALVSLDAEGRELGRLETGSAPLGVDVRDGSVLLLAGGDLRLLDSSLSARSGRSAPLAVAALLCENGAAVLVGRSSAAAEYI